MTGTTISTAIYGQITLGSGGYDSPLVITSLGEITSPYYSPAIYVPETLTNVRITNSGSINGAKQGANVDFAGQGHADQSRKHRRQQVFQ